MKPEVQRIAIAEACGWDNKSAKRGFKTSTVTIDGEEYQQISGKLPDYLNDLNAMHEAESIKDFHYDPRWIENLVSVCIDASSLVFDKTDGWDWALVCARSTAEQRAEAFLRTAGRWEALENS